MRVKMMSLSSEESQHVTDPSLIIDWWAEPAVHTD